VLQSTPTGFVLCQLAYLVAPYRHGRLLEGNQKEPVRPNAWSTVSSPTAAAFHRLSLTTSINHPRTLRTIETDMSFHSIDRGAESCSSPEYELRGSSFSFPKPYTRSRLALISRPRHPKHNRCRHVSTSTGFLAVMEFGRDPALDNQSGVAGMYRAVKK
jgi:hypothetical protein